MKDRFFSKIQQREPDECWPWQAALFETGYGAFMISRQEGTGYAHRLAYEFKHGPIPEGLWVCHICDNRKCCNPNHLFLGLPLDNTRDMIKKGRARYRVVVSDEEVEQIRASEAPARELAAQHNCSVWNIYKIRSGASRSKGL